MIATVFAVLAAIVLWAHAAGFASVFNFQTLALGLALAGTAYAMSRFPQIP